MNPRFTNTKNTKIWGRGDPLRGKIDTNYGWLRVDSNIVAFLNDDEINRIIDKALREHFKDSHKVKRLPKGYLDYALMFTEGGEANAIATAISIAQNEKTTKFLKAKYGEMFK